MTAEEERWIAIILEEGRQADEAEREPAPRPRRHPSAVRPLRSYRDRDPFAVRVEHFVKPSCHHYASMI